MQKFKVGDKVRLIPYETLVTRGIIQTGDGVFGISGTTYRSYATDHEYTIQIVDTRPPITVMLRGIGTDFMWPIWCLEKGGDTHREEHVLKIPDIWNFAEEVTVLGTKYQIIQSTEDEEPRLAGCNGFTDWTSKKIVVHGRDVEGNLDGLDVYASKILRHEIVHAFLIESGLSYCTSSDAPWAESEELVDWIAWQGPKIMQAWKKAGCL